VIERHPFLDPAECEAICARLPDHPELLRDRRPERPGTFITYGRAAYIDAGRPDSDPERDYHAIVEAENELLERLLGDLYPRLLAKLEELLGEPAVYAPELLALPGIHLFRGEGITSASGSGSHFDVQFQPLRFPRPPDDAQPISVTLPLRLPAGGSGLRIHPLTYTDFLRGGRVAREPSIYEEYEVGVLVVHRGLFLHGIAAPRRDFGPEEERITLQCHGIRAGGTWFIYW
jgi:hypothetical protein